MPRLPAAAIACALGVLLFGGCGEEGTAEGTSVTVYVSAPLHGAEGAGGRRFCGSARQEVRQAGSEAGGLKVRVVCLDAAAASGSWTLAQVGSNARRATEDSAAVAYLGEPQPAARRQSRPIVAAAGVAAIGGVGGAEAMRRVLDALRDRDGREPRDAVFEAEG